MDEYITDPTNHGFFIDESLSLDDSSLRPGRPRATNSEEILPGNFSSPTLREIARYGGYSTYSVQCNTDPFVREALKAFDRTTYDAIWGFTRKPQGTIGMYRALSKYNRAHHQFRSLNRDQRRAMTTAIKQARKAFKLPWKREPLDWHQVGEYLRRDTAAGATFMGKRKGEVMEEIYHEARYLAHRMKYSGRDGRFDPTRVRMPPCLAGQRGHMSDRDDPKTRLVWIYPAEMLVVEGCYAPRMYRDFMNDRNSPMLNGRTSQRLYTEWASKIRPGAKLYGIDFSKFDSSVPAWLIRVAFDILRQNIDWEHFDGKPVSKRERQKWRNVWDAMVWYFINTPILMPDGRMFRKRSGVPSGSWFTQMVDSVVCYIVNTYLGLCQQVEIRNLKVLGDDSAFEAPFFDLERGANDARVLDMDFSPDKCESTDDPSDFKLLGVKYHGCKVYRSTDEWFKQALYPETNVASVGMSLTRLVGLWIGGAMHDKLFSRFMEFFQTCWECPSEGWFSKDQRRWMEVLFSGKAPRGWTTKKSLFWRSIFYAYG